MEQRIIDLMSHGSYHPALLETGFVQSPSPKVFFKPMPKCANTALKKALLNYFAPGVFDLNISHYAVNDKYSNQDWIHNLADSAIRCSVEEIPQDSRIVTFVRNPYSRLVSTYLNKICFPSPMEQEFANWIRREALFRALKHGYYDYTDFSGAIGLSFSAFLDYILRDDYFHDIHWARQLSLNGADIIPNCSVIKYENISHELPRFFLKEFNLYIDLSEKVNQSRSDYPVYFSEKLAQKVFDFYRQDFDFFGYEKDSWRFLKNI